VPEGSAILRLRLLGTTIRSTQRLLSVAELIGMQLVIGNCCNPGREVPALSVPASTRGRQGSLQAESLGDVCLSRQTSQRRRILVVGCWRYDLRGSTLRRSPPVPALSCRASQGLAYSRIIDKPSSWQVAMDCQTKEFQDAPGIVSRLLSMRWIADGLSTPLPTAVTLRGATADRAGFGADRLALVLTGRIGARLVLRRVAVVMRTIQ